MVEKLKSRKFIVVVMLMLSVVAAMVSGDLAVPEGLDVMLKGALGYMAGQGLPDAAEKLVPALSKLRGDSEDLK